VGDLLESANDVLENPSLLQGKSVEQVKMMISKTPGWVDDVMRQHDKSWGWLGVSRDECSWQGLHGADDPIPSGHVETLRRGSILENFGHPWPGTRTHSLKPPIGGSMTPRDQYELLLESLRLVAAPADQQLSSLPDFVVATDEVVSTFGDAFLLVQQLQQAGLVSPEVATRLQELDQHFASMPGDEVAEPESLASHVFWTRARLIASDALAALLEDKKPPVFRRTTWVPGA
jgi:hypothetical protein